MGAGALDVIFLTFGPDRCAKQSGYSSPGQAGTVADRTGRGT
jgi:hypothetical protein